MIHSTPRRYGEHRKTEIDNSSPAVGGITNAPNTNKDSGQNRISLKNRQKPLSIAMELDNKQLRLETCAEFIYFFLKKKKFEVTMFLTLVKITWRKTAN